MNEDTNKVFLYFGFVEFSRNDKFGENSISTIIAQEITSEIVPTY